MTLQDRDVSETQFRVLLGAVAGFVLALLMAMGFPETPGWLWFVWVPPMAAGAAVVFNRPLEVETLSWRLLSMAPLFVFAALVLLYYTLGGDATIGKREGPSYYVGSHGVFTRVDEGAYWLSYFMGIALWLSVPAAALARTRLQAPDGDNPRLRSVGFATMGLILGAAIALAFRLPPVIGVPVLLLGAAGVVASGLRRLAARTKGSDL